MMSRRESFMTLTAASLITILGMSTGMVSATNKIDKNSKAISLVAKSKVDKINNQDIKITKSKSSEDTENIMKKQVVALTEAKYEEERAERERLEAEAEAERLAKEAEEQRALIEEQRQAELERQKQEKKEQNIQKQAEFQRLIEDYAESGYNIDIQTRSYWTAEDFSAVVPDTLKPLIPTVIRMEEEKGINAVYLMAVGANEVGWGRKLTGQYNYFNWSIDGVKSLDFGSMEEFTEYSLRGYDKFLNPSYFKGKIDDKGTIPDKITVKVVNTGYAFNADGSVNWNWSEVVCKIIGELTNKKKALGR